MKIILKRHAVIFLCLIGFAVMESCKSSDNNKNRIDKSRIARGGSGEAIPSCGKFRLVDKDIRDNHYENGLDAMLDFQFEPGECEPACSADSVGFIQMVRTVNLYDTTQFYYPSLEKRRRANDRGWYIDRAEGYNCIYFGMDNDSTFLSYASPGTDSRPAWMKDSPYRPENHPFFAILWEAVTVAVHIEGSPDCRGDRRGYYYWSWCVNERGAVEDIKHGTAKHSIMADFNVALEKWNKQADELGKKKFPNWETVSNIGRIP